MTSVCTLLRGRAALTDALLVSFAEANVRNEGHLRLIAGVNNADDARKVTDAGGATIMVNKCSGGDERYRIEFVADLWNRVLRDVETPTVMLWDDDIVPNGLAIARLLSTLAANVDEAKNVAGVVSVYPFREIPTFAVLFNRPCNAIPMSGVNRTIFECFAGGTGLSAWFTAKLKATMPWHIRTLPGGAPAGTDIDIALKLSDAGLKILCDGRVRSEHAA